MSETAKSQVEQMIGMKHSDLITVLGKPRYDSERFSLFEKKTHLLYIRWVEDPKDGSRVAEAAAFFDDAGTCLLKAGLEPLTDREVRSVCVGKKPKETEARFDALLDVEGSTVITKTYLMHDGNLLNVTVLGNRIVEVDETDMHKASGEEKA